MKFASKLIRTSLVAALMVAGTAGCNNEDGNSKAFAEAAGKADQATSDWTNRVNGAMERLRRDRPEFVQALLELEPRNTRAKELRFTGSVIHDTDAVFVLVYRYLNEDNVDVRAALAEALPRTGARFADVAADLIAGDESEKVRASFAGGLHRGAKNDAHRGLQIALADPSEKVRLEAVVALSRRADGAELGVPLSARLSDSSPRVQAAAARAAGVLKLDGSKQAVAKLLESPEANVRLQAVRALGRIDKQYAQGFAAQLKIDADPRIARVASQLLEARKLQAK